MNMPLYGRRKEDAHSGAQNWRLVASCHAPSTGAFLLLRGLLIAEAQVRFNIMDEPFIPFICHVDAF